MSIMIKETAMLARSRKAVLEGADWLTTVEPRAAVRRATGFLVQKGNVAAT